MQTRTTASIQNSTRADSGYVPWLQRKCAGGGVCVDHRKNRPGIGASNDPLEQEADRVADRVSADPIQSTYDQAPARIQRYTGGRAANAAPAGVAGVLSSTGEPLQPALRYDMEQRFGHDFSRVRVHTDANAAQSARDLRAHAYTVGEDLVFAAGRYAPTTGQGRRLLAHELTHVVQQAGTVGMPVVQRQEAQTTPEPEQKETEHKLTLQLTEPDFLGLHKPFFDRNAYQLWDPDSALGVWQFNVDFFKGFGITENWARKAANLTAPFAIDAQLKAGNPTWWEITDRELETTSFVGSVPLFSFDANFRQWKPLPFLEF